MSILRTLGRDNLETLSRVMGGRRLYIPKHYGKPPNGGRDSSVRLKRLFGESLALLLVFHYGDSRILIPKPRDAKPFDRRKLKRLVRSRRLSNSKVAERVGCSLRTAERHRAKLRGQQHDG